MARRKIVWTAKANLERKEILAYWAKRNQSKAYSIKLNKLIKETLANAVENPMIGRKSDFADNVRLRIVRDYLLFYEFDDLELKVLSVWSGHRDEESLSIG